MFTCAKRCAVAPCTQWGCVNSAATGALMHPSLHADHGCSTVADTLMYTLACYSHDASQQVWSSSSVSGQDKPPQNTNEQSGTSTTPQATGHRPQHPCGHG
eukprot:jgi/Ulvmu1/3849/UM018_0066.1